jgi:hypothetical protein
MGQVNSRGESATWERGLARSATADGAQPPSENRGICGLQRGDQQTERLSACAMLAERERFGLSVPGRSPRCNCHRVQPRSAGARPARAELLIFAGGKGLEAALASVRKDVPVQPCTVRTECDLLAQCSEAPGRRLSAPAGNPRPADLRPARRKLAQEQYFQQGATLLAGNVLTFSKGLYC